MPIRKGFFLRFLFSEITKRFFRGSLGVLAPWWFNLFLGFLSTVRQKNRNSVFNRIEVFAFRALKRVFFFAQSGSAGGTDQYVEKLTGDHLIILSRLSLLFFVIGF